MSALDLVLAALGEREPARGAQLPFALSMLEHNPWELRVTAEGVATAASAKGSGVGRLYARVAELSAEASPSSKLDAVTVLHACFNIVGCVPLAIEAYHRPWLSVVTNGVAVKNAGPLKALACNCLIHLLRGVHAMGTDTHTGREVTAALKSQVSAIVRVAEAEEGSDAPALLAAVQCFSAFLTYTAPSVRTDGAAGRMTKICLRNLDSPNSLLARQCHTVLAMLCLQVWACICVGSGEPRYP